MLPEFISTVLRLLLKGKRAEAQQYLALVRDLKGRSRTEFILTVYRFVSASEWTELQEYFALVEDFLDAVVLDISVGKPKDKEI